MTTLPCNPSNSLAWATDRCRVSSPCSPLRKTQMACPFWHFPASFQFILADHLGCAVLSCPAEPVVVNMSYKSLMLLSLWIAWRHPLTVLCTLQQSQHNSTWQRFWKHAVSWTKQEQSTSQWRLASRSCMERVIHSQLRLERAWSVCMPRLQTALTRSLPRVVLAVLASLLKGWREREEEEEQEQEEEREKCVCVCLCVS